MQRTPGIVFVLLLLVAQGDLEHARASVAEGADVAAVRILVEDGGRLDWSPDGTTIAFDRQGSDGCYDTWLIDVESGDERCLTCDHDRLQLPPGNKGQPAFHPHGGWLVIQAEKESHPAPQCSVVANPGAGVYNDLWFLRADGSEAVPARILELSEPRSGTTGTDGRGVLHPHFDGPGTRLTWSEYIRGRCNFQDTPHHPTEACLNEDFLNGTMGHWVVAVADVGFDADGRPTLGPPATFQPGARAFYETHGFTHDGAGVLLSGNPDRGQKAEGMDVLIIDSTTGEVRHRITDTPGEWDEHAHFSPCNDDVLSFTSSRGHTDQATILLYPTLRPPRTDLWLSNRAGDQRQLTFFNDPAWPLRPEGVSESLLVADNSYSPDGRRVAALLIETAPVAGTISRASVIVVMDLTEPPGCSPTERECPPRHPRAPAVPPGNPGCGLLPR